jgi:glycosyltransferase involved in cell wall biosynthesis
MGEESFVDSLPERYQALAGSLMRANARSVDLFLAPGEAYADWMAQFLSVPRERIMVAPSGVRGPFIDRAREIRRGRFVVGFLSSICVAKGLDLLVDAVRVLRDQGRDIALHVAGKPLDGAYWRQVRSQANALGDRFRYFGEVSFAGKGAFLEECDAFCVPSRIAESRGMAVMEAMAAGLPVVVPDRGVFPELIEATHGGRLFAHEDVHAIAGVLKQLMDDPEESSRLGKAATMGIAHHYSVDAMLDATLQAYGRVTSPQSTPA